MCNSEFLWAHRLKNRSTLSSFKTLQGLDEVNKLDFSSVTLPSPLKPLIHPQGCTQLVNERILRFTFARVLTSPRITSRIWESFSLELPLCEEGQEVAVTPSSCCHWSPRPPLPEEGWWGHPLGVLTHVATCSITISHLLCICRQS